MSQWTHVSGALRIDGLPQMGITPDLRSILGQPSSNPFDTSSDAPYREASGIPAGSEGSIQYAINDAGDGLVWKTVAVWGDLRDFGEDDTHEINEWFARIVEASSLANAPRTKLMLRTAHLLVEVEGGMRYVLIADNGVVRRIGVQA